MRLLPLLVGLMAVLAGCKSKGTTQSDEDLQDLLAELRSEVPVDRSRAALELSKRGPAAAAAVPDLMTALEDEEASVRQYAALALGKIGPAAKDAVPALIRALDDPEWTIRRNAAIALGEIGDAEAAPALQKRTTDEIAVVRKAALDAVQKLRK